MVWNEKHFGIFYGLPATVKELYFFKVFLKCYVVVVLVETSVVKFKFKIDGKIELSNEQQKSTY